MINNQEVYYIEDEIQEYIDFLNDNDVAGDLVLTSKKVREHFEECGNALNTLLVYPDIFLDICTPSDSSFKLFFYQRLILRSMSRYRQTYVVATRAASKSFLAFASRFLASMCIPNHHSFVCANLKKQAQAIAEEKMQDDLWVKFPIFATEMSFKISVPGKNRPKDAYRSGVDAVEYNFSHGGSFDVISVESARGKRRNSGLIEEVLEHDGQDLNEKIIPLMNVNRRNMRGVMVPEEPHAAKLYITTAGYHDSFAYEKFIETLCFTAIDPKHYMAISMSYKIPVLHGLIDRQTIKEVIASPSFDRDSFEREYESKWSGSMKGSAFDKSTMNKIRKIVQSDWHNKARDEEFYVISADMAKDGTANTAVVVIKVTPRDYNFLYQIVNAFTVDSTDYLVVSNELKLAVKNYEARLLVYDANGIGAAIRDWLNKESVYNGEIMPGLGIINPPKDSAKDVKKYHPKDTICYEVKASTGRLAGEINQLFFSRLKSGTIKMLIPTKFALAKFGAKASFNKKPATERKRLLRPYQFCDKLEEELLNLELVDVKDGATQVLKVVRRNSKIEKDFFSAFSYGVYVAHHQYEIKYYTKKKQGNAADYIMYG